MLCRDCHGQRFIRRQGQLQPCEGCGGLGIIHCCEGLRAETESPIGDSADSHPCETGSDEACSPF
jgi:hypothetical protein